MGDSPLLDLGLSLGLSMSMNMNMNMSFPHLQTTTSVHDLQLNLRTPCLVQSSAAVSGLFIPPPLKQQALSFTMEESYVSSDADRNSETRAFLLGIDVNRPPSGSMEFEDEAGVSSTNSTISSVSGKRGERETNGEDPENQPAYSRGMSDEEDGENCRKKLRLSKDQSDKLEESFQEHNILNPKQKLALAKQLGLRPRQVEVWFQNRRARTKLKQTEVDCEFLKRCWENLTEENMRLQKEVRELRSLKLSPQFYTRLSPPTTLTVCPSSEHLLIPYCPTSSVGPSGYSMFNAHQPQGYGGSK